MYTLRVSADSTPKVPLCWRGPEETCAPDQAGFSASLINAVSGPARLDWSSSCVPLTRFLKIPWRVLWVACRCQQIPRPSFPGTGGTGRANFLFLNIYTYPYKLCGISMINNKLILPFRCKNLKKKCLPSLI